MINRDMKHLVNQEKTSLLDAVLEIFSIVAFFFVISLYLFI
jgi:hypothetical protein